MNVQFVVYCLLFTQSGLQLLSVTVTVSDNTTFSKVTFRDTSTFSDSYTKEYYQFQ